VVIVKIAAPERFWSWRLVSGQNFLEALVGPAVEAAGYRLVRLRVMGGKTKTVQIMAERPDGHMDVDDCASLSKRLSEVFEAADPIADEYVLEVSSPGIDRPLTRPEDFARFAGHDARVELNAPFDGRRRFKGQLIGLDGNEVLLDAASDKGTEHLRLPLSAVAEAKLILTDRLVQESLKARELRRKDKA
jgi:ribosome maturation factor RimP